MRLQPPRSRLLIAAIAALAAAAVAAPIAQAHPDPLGDHHKKAVPAGPVVQIEAPAELVAELQAFQYAGTPPLTLEGVGPKKLVYAGTGCTPAHYAAVAQEIQGNIAVVDKAFGAEPGDICPPSTFFQKVQFAEQAGAAGFIQIPAEGATPTRNGTALTAGIPAVEVFRTDDPATKDVVEPGISDVRDALIAGTDVTATLRDTRVPLHEQGPTECVDGMAGQFPCEGIDLLSFTPIETFGGGEISDIWGWTDDRGDDNPRNDDEYVMFGTTDGVAFVRVTDPTAPEYLAKLPNPAVSQEIWHDIKVFEDHAFIVSESTPHGMTVFDLTRLRDMREEDGPQDVDPDAVYRSNVSAHNIAINEDTGYAYIVGGSAALVVPDQCLSGLHMVDINDPKEPAFAGCYLMDGGPGTAARTADLPEGAAYIHDTQCVRYAGPDEEHRGSEVCFNSAEDQVTIADVSNKTTPSTLGEFFYDTVGYAHQGWLTEDHKFLITNDELDEVNGQPFTRTVIVDVSDLENPTLHGVYTHATRSIDHNNYTHEGRLYQSNYTTGLRVFGLGSIEDEDQLLVPQAFFDTYPAGDGATFDGTWSNYPYFESGTIAVSGIREGLFLVELAAEDGGEPGGTSPGQGNGEVNGRLDHAGPAAGRGPGA